MRTGRPRAVRRSATRRPVTAAPREPGQRCENDALQPAGRERSLYLVLELLGEQGEVERPRDAAQHRAVLLGEADGGIEELLHLQRRAHLDANERVTVADVREVVLLARWDDDNLTGPRDDPLASHPEAHRALDDLEALLLLRVNMLAARDPPARGQLEVDRQELAARVRRCLAERDPLPAGRVFECLSCVCHASSFQSWKQTVYDRSGRVHAQSSTTLDDLGRGRHTRRHGSARPLPAVGPARRGAALPADERRVLLPLRADRALGAHAAADAGLPLVSR